MNREHFEFEALVVKAQEGTLSADERLLMNRMMRSPACRKIYFEMIKVNCALKQLELPECRQSGSAVVNPGFDENLWEQLANEETTAPAVEVIPLKQPQEFVQNTAVKQVEYKISRNSLVTIIMSVAAVLLVIMFARYVPPKTGFEVATLTDGIDASWDISAAKDTALQKGARLLSGKTLLLQKGLVELLFDTGVRVTFEAPAEFQILSGDQIDMRYGRLYAVVPQGGIGFTVNTQTARVIDLGTEFGVDADFRGDVSLHVMKGKTTLIAGEKSHRASMEVGQGIAKKVSALTSAISDIPCETSLFVRQIESTTNFIWRGQKNIDLADIVGGGNGLGTGLFGAGIDTQTGNYVKQFNVTDISERKPGYRTVSSNPFIDGVFVPDGGNGPVHVNSRGDLFAECPNTSGKYWVGVKNGGVHTVVGQFENQALTLLGTPYNSPEKPAIFIHASQGITFDLAKIRENLRDMEIREFTAICGLSDSIYDITSDYSRDQEGPFGDFWVLVDGQIRFSKVRQQPTDTPVSVAVPIKQQDRFLTILVTDSDRNVSYVWSLFAEPKLRIESR